MRPAHFDTTCSRKPHLQLACYTRGVEVFLYLRDHQGGTREHSQHRRRRSWRIWGQRFSTNSGTGFLIKPIKNFQMYIESLNIEITTIIYLDRKENI